MEANRKRRASTKKRPYPERLKKLDNLDLGVRAKQEKTEIKLSLQVTLEEKAIIDQHKKILKDLGVKQSELLRRFMLRFSDKKLLRELEFNILKSRY